MSFEKVESFFDYVKKKGIVASNTVNGWNGAFSAVESVLDKEEKTIEFILDNPEIIKNRLQNQNHDISGGTLNIYVQRSKRAIKAFKEWSNDRAAWEREMASTKSKPTGPNKKSNNKKKTSTISSSNSSEDIILNTNNKKVFPIPTGSGDSFDVSLPKSYKMDDLPRVIWALAVYAEDFNPAEVLRRYGNPPLKNDTNNQEDDLRTIL